MIITSCYLLLVGLTALALNPFLAFGLAIIDLLITAIIGAVIVGYWQKKAMNDMSENLFNNGDGESPWTQEDMEDLFNN